MSDYPKVQQQISDQISDNLAKLAELFPAAVKDGALDMDALRAELGEFKEVQPGDETYELNWVGKQAAKKEAFKPLLGKTLALKNDGKNTEATQNIYIEGDNLEALKLLRQNYYGEVKMIYIDPPYNTGDDFVYKDRFALNASESDEEEGLSSEEGNRLIKNEKSSNRFHATWLDMMYPRLRLAKELLAENGIIFISIGSNELANLTKLCDEVFGESNFVGYAPRQQKGGGNKGTHFNPVVDYVLAYAKNIYLLESFTEKIDPSIYNKVEKEGPKAGQKYAEVVIYMPNLDYRPNQRFEILAPDGNYITTPEGKSFRWTEQRFKQELEDGNVTLKKSKRSQLINRDGTQASWIPYQKRYYSQAIEESKARPNNLLLEFQNMKGSAELASLDIPFDYPKPSPLIEYLAFISQTKGGDIILDFYSGSSSTAHAVMNLNALDGDKRRYIMVQLPEVCEENSEAAKDGYKNISEIGKERIRRAGEKIKEELQAKHAEWKERQALEAKKGEKLELEEDAAEESNPYVIDPDSLDIGFKSFRIEDTKINWLKKDLRGEQLEFSDTTTQDALDFVPGFTDVDVVYELMLRQSNIPLTGAITQPDGTGKRTYLYADTFLICLEEKVTKELVETLAALEPTPAKYIFRDSAFGKDIALKDETFRRLKAEIEKHHGDTGSTYTVEFI